MKYIKKLLILTFHTANLLLITFYLYPGAIFGYILHGDSSIQLQFTKDFIISSNHLYAFIILSTLGIIAYQNTKKIKFIIVYLFFLSIILELFHLIVPNRVFEMSDLFGNIIGVVLVIITYKVKDMHV